MTSAFAQVLDSALSRLGMPLDRVVEHVARRGARCSVSTLSLWRRGRTRPSLARSAGVLAALDDVLDLPAGALEQALAEPDVGAAEWWASRVPIHQVADVHEAFRTFREVTGLEGDDDLERLRGHLRVELGEDRTVRRTVYSQLVRARRDGAQRLGGYRYTEERTADDQPAVFELESVLGGRVVHQADFTHLGATALLLELDQPLPAGEVAPLELTWHRLTDPPPLQGWGAYEIRHPWPIGQLSMEACFRPEDVPTAVQGVAVPRLDGHQALADQPATALPPGACLELSADHVLGGGVRLAWTWDGESA